MSLEIWMFLQGVAMIFMVSVFIGLGATLLFDKTVRRGKTSRRIKDIEVIEYEEL